MIVFNMYLCRDKSEPCVVIAPDRDNAQTMVDQATRLHWICKIARPLKLQDQGKINLEKLLNLFEET